METSIVDLTRVSSEALAAFEQAGRPVGAWPLLPLLAPPVEPAPAEGAGSDQPA